MPTSSLHQPLSVNTSGVHGLPSTAHHNRKSSNGKKNKPPKAQFHRRATSAVPVPKPSHKPPSTFHSFRGDIRSQDIFVESIKKRNDRIRILFPGADRFETQRNLIWNTDAICTPSLILQPRSEREISDCLKGYGGGVKMCLSANRKGAKIAVPRLCIAGGRNSFNCMRDGSIVLDMSKMHSVKYNPADENYHQRPTVKVQGGAKVIDVDSTLAEHGMMAVLGTFQHLGVVGSILAGGLGFASRKHGLACDNVVAASIILADGNLKKCNREQFQEELWSICGGGGGIGVVSSITLKCFPLRHAALLTYDLASVDLQQKRMAMRRWCNWINGDVDNDDVIGNDDGSSSRSGGYANEVLTAGDPAANEVYSQISLLTRSNTISVLASSIDTNAINQTDGFIDRYNYEQGKAKKKGGFLKRIGVGNGAVDPSDKPDAWQRIPSLADLATDSFGVGRKRTDFRLVKYADQLQSHSNEYFTQGNIFLSVKFAKSLTHQIMDVLLQATGNSDISPKNESKIIIMAMGGCIGKSDRKERTSFSARNSKYMIYIEGKWDAVASHKLEKEKNKVKNWVHGVVKRLHKCDGVVSSAVPESMRDLVSKSGNSKPPPGWYNFSEASGRKLNRIKYKRDPRNVFSFASRVSWSRSLSTRIDVDDLIEDDVDTATISTDITKVESVKDGEIQPTDCLTPQKSVLMQTQSEELNDSNELDDNSRDIQTSASEVSADNSQDDDETSLRSDVRRLLVISDGEDDLKDWSLAPVPLQRSDFDQKKYETGLDEDTISF